MKHEITYTPRNVKANIWNEKVTVKCGNCGKVHTENYYDQYQRIHCDCKINNTINTILCVGKWYQA